MGRRNDALQNPVSALGAHCFGQDVVLEPFVGSGGADFSSRSACSAAGELGGGFLKFIFAARLPKSPPISATHRRGHGESRRKVLLLPNRSSGR